MTADKNHSSFIHDLQVATPCKANWDEMTGDEQKRACGMCKMNVYNLSAMTLKEAEELVLRSEGRTCIRMYRRADGTVITRDCPVGIAERMKLGMKKTFAIASGVAAILIAWAMNARPDGGLTVWQLMTAKLAGGTCTSSGGGRAMMGEMVAPAQVEMGKMKAPLLHEPVSAGTGYLKRRAPLPLPLPSGSAADLSSHSAAEAPPAPLVPRLEGVSNAHLPLEPKKQTPRGYIKIDNSQ